MGVLIILCCFGISFLWTMDHYQINQEIHWIESLIIEKDYFRMIQLTTEKTRRKALMERLIVSFIGGILAFFIFDGEIRIVYSAIVILVIYKGIYLSLKKKVKIQLEIAKNVFPFYLNNLCILIQTNPVPLALQKSIQMAPTIFKDDLEILVKEIHEGKKERVIPYLEFAQKFEQIPDLMRIYRTLYYLSVTVVQKEMILLSLCKIANEKLVEERKRKLDNFLDHQSLVPWIAFLWVGLVIIALFNFVHIQGFL